jgi:hypothetical protein
LAKIEELVARQHRSVRIDSQLLDELERAARDRLVPATFAEQVDRALRLLLARANDRRLRQAAALLAADTQAEALFDRLHGTRR